MISRIRGTIGILAVFISSFAASEEIRDFYSEPGLNPFKEEMLDLNEAIDPFSGTLQQKYVDLHIPGNGGLDISVNRVYTSRQDNAGLGTKGYTGLGWTMHFGRIVVPTAHRNKICSQQIWSVHTQDNPSIEFSDGGREMLVLSDFHTDETLITKTNWKADCQNVTQGMRVTAPDGMKYYMDVAEYTQDQYSWYTSRIEDREGNWINISYAVNPEGIQYIDSVSASDGRFIDFQYENETTTGIVLQRLVANGHTTTYGFTELSGLNTIHRQLSSVRRSDGRFWRYTYYPQLSAEVAGSHNLESVTYPHGGRITYTYQFVRFEPTSFYNTTTIASKMTLGLGITSGTWSYTFTPAEELGEADQTVVSTPDGRIEYDHQGYVTGAGLAWPVGLLHQKRTYQGSTLKETITNHWGTRQISLENYWHGRNSGRLDNETLAPVMLSTHHSVFSNGTGLLTTYNDHDQYGNPRQIIEESGSSRNPDRVKNILYDNDTWNWLIGLPEEETIVGTGTISRDYFPGSGRVRTLTEYGVTTHYTYTPQGDLETETNARSFTKTYSDYYRGIARHEEHEVGLEPNIVIDRTVNSSGTVASLTNGERHTTIFDYNGLNQLTGIQFPIHQDVTIDYDLRSKVLTRGSYQERTTLNGFGKPVQFEREDLTTANVLTTTTRYDALGRTEFSSYPNSTDGTTYEYDTIGRQVRITHADSSFSTIEYGTFLTDASGGFFADKRVTDERGNVSYFLSLHLGSYNQNLGVVSLYNEENATAVFRNDIGMPTQVAQGLWDKDTNGLQNAVFRTFNYNANFFLDNEVHPETGTTYYGRDEIGNKISSRVNTSFTTQYTYDGLNRLKTVDYPEAAPDVGYEYDRNSNLKMLTKGTTEWLYGYDDNSNLVSEILTVHGDVIEQLSLTYGRNLLDHVDSLTYPNGTIVSYLPDAFGRPTQASGYVNSVTYHPNGQMASMQYANGTTTRTSLNQRQLVETIQTGLGTGREVADFLYGYDDASNLTSVQDGVRPQNNLILDYDELDRLTISNGPWGDGTYSYTPHGDIYRTILGDEIVTRYYGNDEEDHQRLRAVWYTTQIDPTTTNTHKIHYADHDVYGNLTVMNNVFGDIPRLYTYDHASNLILAENQENDVGSIRYEYDGNDQIVSETGSTFKKLVVSNKSGVRLFEKSIENCDETQYVYIGNLQVAKDQQASNVDLDGNGVNDCLDYDLDSDGLSTNDEITIGTDPMIPDSDRDGMPDGYESDHIGLNPLTDDANADLDGDGVQNIEEYLDGTAVDDSGSYENSNPQAVDDRATLYLNIAESPLGAEGITYDIYTGEKNINEGLLQAARDQVVVFSDDTALVLQANDAPQISGHFYDAMGNPKGVPFELFSASGNVTSTQAVRLNNDSFVVVWRDETQTQNLQGRIFDKTGESITNEFTIAQTERPVVDIAKPIRLMGGGFAVAWSTWEQDTTQGYLTTIQARVFDDSGTPIMDPVFVQDIVPGRRFTDPKIEQFSNGRIAVGWQKQALYDTTAIFVRILSENLVPVTESIKVDATATIADMVSLPGQRMVLLWLKEDPDDALNERDIQAKVIDSNGQQVAANFRVNDLQLGDQFNVNTVATADGGFVIFWQYESFGETGDRGRKQRYDADLQKVGDQQTRTVVSNPAATTDGGYFDSLGRRYFTRHVGERALINILGNDLDPDHSDDAGSLLLVDATVREGIGTVVVENNKLRIDLQGALDSLPPGGATTLHIDYTVSDDSGGIDYGVLTLDVNQSIIALNEDFEGTVDWTITLGNGARGGWEVGEPFNSSVAAISGQNILAAGLLSGDSLNGLSSAVSPQFRVPDSDQLELFFWYSIYCGNASSERITVDIINDAGTHEIFVDRCESESSNSSGDNNTQLHRWVPVWFDLSQFRNQDVSVQLEVNNGSRTFEAAVDDLKVIGRLGAKPQVTVASPADGASFSNIESVVFSANATDIDGSDISAEIVWNSNLNGYIGLGNSFSRNDLNIGVHEISASVNGDNGTASSITHSINIYDSTDIVPPELFPPTDLYLEANGVLSTVDLGVAVASDDIDGTITPQADSVGPFGLGLHQVIWRATDMAGNETTANQVVFIRDTTPPDLTVPADIVVASDSPLAVDIGEATAADIFAPAPISNDAPATFAVGETLVAWSATDANGNTISKTQKVTVSPTGNTLPQVTIASPWDGAVLPSELAHQLNASATDSEDGNLSSTIVWTSDRIGQLGTGGSLSVTTLDEGIHTLRASAADSDGAIGAAAVVVEVSATNIEIVTIGENGPFRQRYIDDLRISDDVNLFVFTTSYALVGDDTNNGSDIYLRDRSAGITKRISINSAGEQAEAGSFSSLANTNPEISPNGRYVVFSSNAINLDVNDTYEHDDIFIRDLEAQTTSILTSAFGGGPADGPSYSPDVSADGRYISFLSFAGNLVSNDTNGEMDLFLLDRNTGEIRIITTSNSGDWFDGYSGSYNTPPQITADGRYVVFSTNSRAVVGNDNDGFYDVFVYDRDSDETTVASVSTTGEKGNGNSHAAFISDDGRFVLFKSSANNLTSDLLEDASNYYRHDRTTGETVLITGFSPSAIPFANGGVISGDGRFVVLSANTESTGIRDTNAVYDVYVKDMSNDRIERVSVGPNGEEGDGNSNRPRITADGNYIAFLSTSNNFMDGDNGNGTASNGGYVKKNVLSNNGGSDSTPPVVTAPADVTVEADALLTSVDIGIATAVDETDGAVVPTANLSGPFAVGQHIVTWSASDAAGNSGVATQLITVQDTTPPVLSLPADTSVNSDVPIAVDIGEATATDIFDVTITNDAPALFDVVTTAVTWVATDANGNQSTGEQQVTVSVSSDTTPPVVTAPADITIEATAELTPVALGIATATDDVDGDLTSTADLSGPFSVGTHTVTWSATDSAGNNGTAAQTVVVEDTTAPVITAPADVSVSETPPATVAIGTATATDIFSASITNDAPATFPAGTTVVTWTATDANGNSSSATQNVTVTAPTDTTPPVVTPPANITIEATAVQTPVTLGSASASDDVDGSLTATADQTGPFSVGTHTVTWSATDSAGNTGTATQTLIIQDTTAPLITVPSDVSVTETPPATVAIGTATATDIFTVSITNDAPATFPAGTTVVTWTATDANGNSSSATQSVTVTAPADTTPPVVTAPANITVEATALQTPVTLGSATATDNVDGALTPTPNQSGPFGVGTHTVIWSVTDSAGNIGTATQTVTVQDTAAPVITSPANVSVTATPPATVAIGTATATDIFPVTVSNDAPASFPAGTTVVTWSATDTNGNSSSATQNVTVTAPVDTTPPVVTPPANVTVEATALQTPVNLGAASATDNVDGALTPTPNQSGPFGVGTHTVIWSATDSAGNIGTATQTVIVQDTTTPTIVPPTDVSVTAMPPVILAIGTATATDIFPVTISNDAPAAFAAGTSVVTWTATDANGNSSSATQNVTVTIPVDTTPPVVTPPADVTVEATAFLTPVNLGSATATDDVDGVLNPLPDQAGPFGVGTHTVTWSATDSAGNTATATQTVIVQDTTAPLITVPTDISVEATELLTPVLLGSATAFDEVDGALAPAVDLAGPFGVGVHTVTWSITDSAGNTGSATQIVTVLDTTPPVITAPTDVSVTATPPASVVIGTATASDIFPVTVTNDAPAVFPAGTTVVTWTASDENGNSSNATQLVTVIEDVPGDIINGTPGNDTLEGSSGDETLNGFEGDDTLFGYAGNDILVGGIGNDLHDGGTGVDIMQGGFGDDIYLVDNPEDLVIEEDSEGLDEIRSQVSYGLAPNLETLVLQGSAAIDGSGNNLDNLIEGNRADNRLSGIDGDDTLTGKTGNDTLVGGAGDDRLNGGADNDRLNGGSGTDTLRGGTGDDTYLFNQDHGQDRIVEADEAGSNDRLRFKGGTDRYDLWLHRDGNHLVLTRLNSMDQVTVSRWYSRPDMRIERVIIPRNTAAGIERSRLFEADVQSLVEAMAPFGPPVDGVVNLTPTEQQAINAAIDAAWR
ncbi:MAG: HYR domain-containing protein [Candidatus Thiodiazotropha sp. L084R]